MKQYVVLFRQPDGCQRAYDSTFTQQQGKLLGGQSLSLDGGVLLNAIDPAQVGPH